MALTVPDAAIDNEKLALSYRQAKPETGDVVVASTHADAPTEIVSLDVELNVDGVYLIFAKVISQAEAGEQVVVELWDEEGLLPAARAFNTAAQTGPEGRETSTLVTIAPFSAGTHTVRLMAYMGTGEEGTIDGDTELNVIPLGQP
jgi:propanediol dehydratase large subunit